MLLILSKLEFIDTLVRMKATAIPEEYEKFRYLWESQDAYYFIRTGVYGYGRKS